MSWLAYEILRIQPDFGLPPQWGIGASGRQDLRIGQSEEFARWVGDSPLAARFRFRVESATQLRQLREFLTRRGGSAEAFLMPSWARDYRLTTAGEVGDETVEIESAGLAGLTEDRPDTEGRVLWALNPARQLEILHVVSAEADGSTETLTLEQPLTVPLGLQSVLGVCRLVRLADDNLQWLFYRPGFGRLDLRVMAARNTRRLDQEESMGSQTVGDLQPFVDLIAEDLDPYRSQHRTATARGPQVYGVPPQTPYATTWTARPSSGGDDVILDSEDGASETSALYDEGSASPHLALGWDAGGFEVLAWTRPSAPEVVRVGYRNAGSAEWIQFEGISPVAVNTWGYDGNVSDSANAEAVVVYLRPGRSALFVRIEDENFQTEHRVESPVVPLYLDEIGFQDGYLEVRGMDAGHRRTRWRFGPYVPPLPPEELTTTYEPAVSGEYFAVRMIGPAQDEDTDPTMTWTSASVQGDYVPVRFIGPAQDDDEAVPSMTWTSASVSGELTQVRFIGPAQDEDTDPTMTWTSASVQGDYTLVRIDGPSGLAAGAETGYEADVSGTYQSA